MVHRCTICELSFESDELLSEHSLHHAGEQDEKCDTCNQWFVTKNDLKTHILLMHSTTGSEDSKTHFQTLADKIPQKKHFEPHIQTDIFPKISMVHKCTICELSFASDQFLSEHLLHHAGEQDEKCYTCNQWFVTKNDLKTHISLMHPTTGSEDSKAHFQTLADKIPQKTHFETHIQTDISPKKEQNNSLDIDKQSESHKTEKIQKCKLCGKTFKSNFFFEKHLRWHTEETVYKCSVCNRSFKNEILLLEHNRIHTGERPYECTLCNKNFRTRVTLKSHCMTKSHLSKILYECKVCTRKFNYKQSLDIHQLTNHTEDIL